MNLDMLVFFLCGSDSSFCVSFVCPSVELSVESRRAIVASCQLCEDKIFLKSYQDSDFPPVSLSLQCQKEIQIGFADWKSGKMCRIARTLPRGASRGTELFERGGP